MLVTTSFYEQLIMGVKGNTFTNWTPPLQVGLYTNNVTLTRNTTFSNLVEASFPGYARVNIGAFGVAYLNANGFWQIDRSSLAVFQPASIGAGQQVYGYFVGIPPGALWWAEANPAGPTLVGASLLPYIVQISFQESQFNPTNP